MPPYLAASAAEVVAVGAELVGEGALVVVAAVVAAVVVVVFVVVPGVLLHATRKRVSIRIKVNRTNNVFFIHTSIKFKCSGR